MCINIRRHTCWSAFMQHEATTKGMRKWICSVKSECCHNLLTFKKPHATKIISKPFEPPFYQQMNTRVGIFFRRRWYRKHKLNIAKCIQVFSFNTDVFLLIFCQWSTYHFIERIQRDFSIKIMGAYLLHTRDCWSNMFYLCVV